MCETGIVEHACFDFGVGVHAGGMIAVAKLLRDMGERKRCQLAAEIDRDVSSDYDVDMTAWTLQCSNGDLEIFGHQALYDRDRRGVC